METRTCVDCGAIAHPRDPRCVDCVKRAAMEWTIERHARSIAALAAIEAKEAAPKPDELTVEDVLGMLDFCLCDVGGFDWVNDHVRLSRMGADAWYAESFEPSESWTGTLRKVLTEAKRRGLLG